MTKKFINLIKHAEDGILDLNKAADTLEVTTTIQSVLHFVYKPMVEVELAFENWLAWEGCLGAYIHKVKPILAQWGTLGS